MLDDLETLAQLLQWRVEATPAGNAYRWFDHNARQWIGCTWAEFDARVDRWRQALAAENLAKGDRIAILVSNGIEHVSMDQAALSMGLVPVPMHAVDNPESIAYVLNDSGASVLLIDTADRWHAIAASGSAFDALKRIVCCSAAAAPADRRIVLLDDWLTVDAPSRQRGNPVSIVPTDLAAIVYTSGTTGRPKGVMLSHRNVVANVQATLRRVETGSNDVFLSFLPLSHTFERTAGYYLAIAAGACVAFARSTRQIPEDLKSVQPTMIASVPRIYERFYANVMERAASASAFEKLALRLTLDIGNRRFEARQGRGGPPSVSDRLLWPILQRLVARRILAEFGGRLRVAVSGGAPIAEPVIRLFLALGLDILQGYGMTETSPVVSTNAPSDNDPKTVGRPLDNVEVRIGENGELMVRGPSVMLGYWHKPEETRRAITPEGWLHTGDLARIENGRISITGRIKDIIVTSTGEKVPPADLEMAITSDPLFEQAMVIGENRRFIAALVVLNATEWAKAKAAGGDVSERALLLRRIAEATKGFPAYAMPRAVYWTMEPWTIETGLLTPTLKIKRPALEHLFAREIEKLYA